MTKQTFGTSGTGVPQGRVISGAELLTATAGAVRYSVCRFYISYVGLHDFDMLSATRERNGKAKRQGTTTRRKKFLCYPNPWKILGAASLSVTSQMNGKAKRQSATTRTNDVFMLSQPVEDARTIEWVHAQRGAHHDRHARIANTILSLRIPAASSSTLSELTIQFVRSIPLGAGTENYSAFSDQLVSRSCDCRLRPWCR
ncbi:hypothetical protein EDC01DRAFT_628285 [Geopyxis carbonaria]|nr:hypothetical protein EDC01DRAFT_628285 [Geopyxis carbonaria]